MVWVIEVDRHGGPMGSHVGYVHDDHGKVKRFATESDAQAAAAWWSDIMNHPKRCDGNTVYRYEAIERP